MQHDRTNGAAGELLKNIDRVRRMPHPIYIRLTIIIMD